MGGSLQPGGEFREFRGFRAFRMFQDLQLVYNTLIDLGPCANKQGTSSLLELRTSCPKAKRKEVLCDCFQMSRRAVNSRRSLLLWFKY